MARGAAARRRALHHSVATPTPPPIRSRRRRQRHFALKFARKAGLRVEVGLSWECAACRRSTSRSLSSWISSRRVETSPSSASRRQTLLSPLFNPHLSNSCFFCVDSDLAHSPPPSPSTGDDPREAGDGVAGRAGAHHLPLDRFPARKVARVCDAQKPVLHQLAAHAINAARPTVHTYIYIYRERYFVAHAIHAA